MICKRSLALLLALASLPLAGCAGFTNYIHSPAFAAGNSAALAFVQKQAVSIAEKTVLNLALSAFDRDAKEDWLSSAASALRTQAEAQAVSISGSDLAAIVKAYTPEKAHWNALSDQLGALYDTQKATGEIPPAQLIELIASGLNAATASNATP